MVTVLERNESTIIRDRSQFIGILVHVTNDKSVPDILKSIRNEYPKAKHYCYAYVIDGKKKCSDDGEPAKTAGRPLLELLEKKEMDEVLLVVVRYFGGVLLGASRLMSTYLETGVEVIRTCDLVNIENKFIYHMELTYSEFDCLKRLIKQTSMFLENIVYGDTISLDILCDENDGTLLTEWFPKSPIEVNGNKKVYRR
ncbi:MAG: YigZ family protein [Bacilli bacterium]|nr:YigZ family protein [Bacilli bacterium]